MPCKWCASELQGRFVTEITIHLKDINKPHVLIFPQVIICLKCGKPEFATEFRVGETELSLLARRDAVGA